jgi:hypothetical protein
VDYWIAKHTDAMKLLGKSTKITERKDLKEELEQYGVSARGKVLSKIPAMCQERDIFITSIEKYILERWVGNPQGIRQVAWKSGLLDHKTH